MAKVSPKSSALDRFQRVGAVAVPRIIGASAGEVGTGKTHFWLTAPGPIVVFSFDQGMEGVVEPFAEDKDIRVREYEWAPGEDLSQDEAIKLRNEFCDDFEAACSAARTVIVDKETDLWELFRYAEFGGPSDRPNNYSALNQRYRKLINHPKKLSINVGFVQSLKDEWVSVTKADGREKGSSTGNRIRTGFKELAGLVHVDLFHERKGGVFYTTIGKSRGPGCRDVQDKTFNSEDGFDFATLGQMLFPDTDESDWK